ncbi:MAG: hypothetical protein AAGG72_07745, partial [Pseudomonadota bacterium]
TELLALLCGVAVEGEEILTAHGGLIRWIASATPGEIKAFESCIYDCPLANEMDAATLKAYAFSGKVDIQTDLHPLAAPRDAIYHFREEFCNTCPVGDKRCDDPMIINSMTSEEVLASVYRKHFARHLPVMIIRSSAKWHVIKQLEGRDDFGDKMRYSQEEPLALRDQHLRRWFESALPYLKANPL